MRKRGRWMVLGLGLGLAGLAFASCDGDSSPMTAATGGAGGQGGEGGTFVDPCPTEPWVEEPANPPDPGTPTPAPTIDCGTATFPDGTGLRRKPYLQSVTNTTARVAWTATNAVNGKVRWATSAAGPWTEVDAVPEDFDVERTNDTEPYRAFDARLEGLSPGEAYCYEVLVDDVVVASGLSLHTAWSGSERPVRVLAFGDSGALTPEQFALRDMFMTREFDVFLHLGDMAYGDGTFVEFEERVFDVYADFMHGVPSYPTIGNHEYKTDNAQPYLDVYYLWEQALREEDQERYYSFDYGNVHFVSLDSNDRLLIPIGLDSAEAFDDDMIDWLRDDLAMSDAPWKIAFFHHPPFSMYDDRSDNTRVINLILPALRDGDVDLILVGHDHHYVRSVPVRGDCKVPGGDGAIPFIVVGGGGTGLREFGDPDDWYMAAGNDQLHAFLSLTLHGCEGRGEAIAIDGSVIDTFLIDGCANGEP